MKENNQMKYAVLTGRILLGLLFLVPGLMKLMDVSSVTGMLEGIGFPIAVLFTWILILSEIIFGVAILANYRLEYAVIPPIVILLVAMFTLSVPAALQNPSGWINVLFHLVAVSYLWTYGAYAKGK